MRSQHQNNLITHRPNQTTFGTNSLTSPGAKIWNTLPGHIKNSENLNQFLKKYLKIGMEQNAYAMFATLPKKHLFLLLYFTNYQELYYNSN